MVDFSKLTVTQVRELASMANSFLNSAAQQPNPTKTSAYILGQNYMFRTVTHIVTGKVVSIHSDGIVVTDAAWVADTGRYMQAVSTGDFKEVEPYPDGVPVVVNFNAVVDAVVIPKLPRAQK